MALYRISVPMAESQTTHSQLLCFFHILALWPAGMLRHGSSASKYPLSVLYCFNCWAVSILTVLKCEERCTKRRSLRIFPNAVSLFLSVSFENFPSENTGQVLFHALPVRCQVGRHGFSCLYKSLQFGQFELM